MLFNKIVKKFALVLIVVLSLTTFVACGDDSGSNDSSRVAIWSATNTDVIMQNASKGSGEAKISFNTFKGDVESAQILFTAKEYIKSFDFKMGDVANENGDKISANSFEVFAQKYINVRIPTSDDCLAGYYPDALVPFKNYCLKRDNIVMKDCNQGIWINLNVPTDVASGVYTGNAVLTTVDRQDKAEDISIPISVTIFNITMPNEIHTVSSFYFEASHIGMGEGRDRDLELEKTYYDFMLKKRANVRDIPKYFKINTRYDAKLFANDVVEYARNPMVSCYALPYLGGATAVIDGQEVKNIVDYNYCYEIINELAKKNAELLAQGENIDLFKKAHYYLGSLVDEPTSAKFPNVRACDLNIHKAKLAVAKTGVLDAYPEVKESLLSLRHVVTTKIEQELYGTDTVGGVQTWCPLIDNFDTKVERELALERMNSTDRTGGEDVWWYSCVNPKNPWPSYQTDEDMLLARVRGWMQYDFKVQGNLYWAVNFWQRHENGEKKETDIWTEALSWEGGNGDGRLIYPGKKYGVDGPISTFRLENIRESNEDYEILWLFEHTINDINKSHSKSYDSDKILSSFYNRLYEDTFVNKDLTEKQFDDVRIELLQLLEKMINNPTSAFSQLDSLN